MCEHPCCRVPRFRIDLDRPHRPRSSPRLLSSPRLRSSPPCAGMTFRKTKQMARQRHVQSQPDLPPLSSRPSNPQSRDRAAPMMASARAPRPRISPVRTFREDAAVHLQKPFCAAFAAALPARVSWRAAPRSFRPARPPPGSCLKAGPKCRRPPPPGTLRQHRSGSSILAPRKPQDTKKAGFHQLVRHPSKVLSPPSRLKRYWHPRRFTSPQPHFPDHGKTITDHRHAVKNIFLFSRRKASEEHSPGP